VGNALRVVQAQRHVHSATCSDLSAGFAGSPHALAVEIDPVGVMDQAIEDGVGIGGVADQRVPLIDRELAGDDGGAAAVAVLKDLQEVVASPGVERLEAPVVEDEKIDTAERAQDERPRHPGRHHPGMVGEIIPEWWATSSGISTRRLALVS